ncbi:MAG: HDOD domain-containing protein, partial [Phycisphaerae bacterium]
VRDVVRLVESDQSLSARLVSLAARAHTGAKVGTVDQAVLMLGLDAVRSLVLSVQIFENFSHRKERPGRRFNRVEFWKHSLAVGCAARLLADEAGRVPEARALIGVPPEEGFVCGLLHDLGKVVLDACFPKSYDRVVGRVEERGGCIADVEREFFGLDHALGGYRLATHWQLPGMIAESIWLHHGSPALTPERLAHPRHVRLVQAADRLARQMRIGYSGNPVADLSGAELAAAVGLPAEALERVSSALPELVEERSEFLGLDRLTSKQVYEEALARANAELARANQALADSNRRLEHRSRCFEAVTRLRGGIGQVPTHERIAAAAAGAAAGFLRVARAAVLAYSPARGVWVLAGGSAEGESPEGGELLPAGDAGAMGFVADARPAWLPASLLAGTLLDRISALLEAPPAWCYPLRHAQGFAGALVVGGARPADDDEMLVVLADWIATWLAGAESAAAARRLNEELAETHRRLLASQAELTRTRSLAMIGEMAAGAAHELNNPLAVISGRAQLLDREELGPEVRKAAGLIREHAHKASGMVSELMEFAKPPAPAPAAWEVAGLLEGLLREWVEQGALAKNQLTIHISKNSPRAYADPAHIRTILNELIRNAVQAMRQTPEPRLVVNCAPDVADDRIVIRVQDNGCGMTPEVLERAFTPFFSHRQAGRGRGLGLAKAARYAEINGGRLRLTSTPGEGTTACLELPVARG